MLKINLHLYISAQGPGECIALSEDLSKEQGCKNLASELRAREVTRGAS